MPSLEPALEAKPRKRLAERLMLPVGNDTLLRVVRRHACRPEEPPCVVGVDDWAFRRNHRYGSIVCDLERRQVRALLPDREVATVERWLAAHPTITVVSRDRGGAMARQPRGPCRTLSRSPTAGI